MNEAGRIDHFLTHRRQATVGVVAERVRAAVAAMKAPAPVTVSVGLGSLDDGATAGRVELMQSADGALHEAERLGLDRVCERLAASPSLN